MPPPITPGLYGTEQSATTLKRDWGSSLLSDSDDRPRVLLVEDERLILMELKDTLEGAGFTVLVASSGAEALALLDPDGEPVDALVTDVDLGDGPTGWDVAHAAREGNPGLAVVYASSSSPSDWAVNGVPNSVFISKPFAPTQIVVAVSERLNATTPLPSDGG
jgi:DNA-binding response OmpR family regulator